MSVGIIVRSLIRDWRFSLFVVVIVGAGIALNTATFTIADGILSDPLAVSEPERLVRVFVKAPWGDEYWPQMSFPDYRTIRDATRTLSSVAGFANDLNLDVALENAEPVRATGAMATGNFFRTVGVTAQRGRFFDAEDERQGHAVVVISDDFWRRYFRAADSAIGASTRVNTTTFTIIGVAPPRFHGVVIDTPADIWMPVAMWPTVMPSFERLLEDRETSWLSVAGRLQNGVDPRTAGAEIRTLLARETDAQVYGALERAFDQDRRPQIARLTMFLGVFVALILIIAWVNAASLQLVRGERRQREMAIRAAIGASRGALLRQLIVEGVVLAAAAGALGLALAHLVVRMTLAWAPESFPLMLHAARPVIDGRVMLLLFALTAIGSLACGLIPALRATRVDLQQSLRGDRVIGGSSAIRGALVVVQIALSVVVLIAAGLMVRSLRNMQRVALGFETRDIATATLNLARQGYDDVRATEFFKQLRERLAATPGVRAVAIGRTMPIDAGGMLMSVSIPGYAPPSGDDERAPVNVVAPGFFSALGVPILRGREFTGQETKDGDQVAIVNDIFARHFWSTDDVVGKQFAMMRKQVRIVGVVRSTRYHDFREQPFPIVFRPLAQLPTRSAEVAVRAANAQTILRDTIRSIDPNLPIHDLQSLRDRAGIAWQREEAVASMLTLFGALALLLAAVGLFSVISYRTETRRREIGVRIAIGARGADIVRLVLRQTGALLLAGIAAGLVAAAFAGRLATSLLYDVSPFDSVTFASVSCVFIAAGLIAATLPALRALRVDAAEVLRAE